MLTYVPTSLPDRAPVVVLLHGGTGGMLTLFQSQAGASREWPYVADDEGFLLMVPNGVNPDTGDTAGDQQNWNDLRPVGTDRDSDADDVGFLRKVIDHAVTVHRADPLRVYFTGGSNGGQMTYRVMMELSGKLAGCAVGSANLNEPNDNFREPTKPIPLLMSQGTEDPLMLYEGDSGKILSSEATVAWWVARNGSGPAGVETSLPNLDPNDGCQTTWHVHPGGPRAAPVEFLKVIGGGHVAPSILHPTPENVLTRRILGIQSRDFETARRSWDFLKEHSIPLRPMLNLSAAGNGRISGEFIGGYPSGEARLMVAGSLDEGAEWIEVAASTLNDLGQWLFDDLADPRPNQPTQGFYRIEASPLGGF